MNDFRNIFLSAITFHPESDKGSDIFLLKMRDPIRTVNRPFGERDRYKTGQLTGFHFSGTNTKSKEIIFNIRIRE